MPYFTTITQVQDARQPGQTIKFKKGKGYYLVGTVLPYEGYLSPAQRQTEAAAQAEASLAPTRHEYELQQKEAEDYALAQQRALTAFMRAAGMMTAGDAEAIKGVYTGAAENQAGFAKGFSDRLEELATESNTKNADYLRSIGVTPTGSMPAESGADALYAGRGYVPAGTFTEQGAHAFAGAKGGRQAMLTSFGEAGQLALAKGEEARKQIQDRIRELEATRPGLIRQVMGDLQSGQTGLWATQVQQDYLRKAQKESAGLDAYGNLQPGYTIGTLPDGTQVVVPPGYVVDKKGNIVKSADATKAAGARATAVGKRNGAIQQAKTQMAKAVLSAPLTRTVKGLMGETTVRMEWNAAREYLWNVYGEDLLRYASPAGKAALRRQILSAIDGILRANGFAPKKKTPNVPVAPGQKGPPAPGRKTPGPFRPQPRA